MSDKGLLGLMKEVEREGDSETRDNQFGGLDVMQSIRGQNRIMSRIVKNDRGTWVINVFNPTYVDYKASFEAFDYKLATNGMNGYIHVNGKLIDDAAEAKIVQRLKDFGMKSIGDIERCIKIAASENEFHPLKDYFKSLKWDGEDRISQLVECIETETENAPSFIRKWLGGAVARLMDDEGTEQNYMLVLLGGQGAGKSELAKWLCPVALKYFYAGSIHPEKVDDIIRQMNFFLWEAAELGATTSKAGVEALKQFITLPNVNVRIPYARYKTHKPAITSFIGTVNPSGTGFLRDTSNRRFVVLDIKGIDWSYVDIDKDQLWAQVYHEWSLDNLGHRLTHEEKIIQETINKQYRLIDTAVEWMEDYFEFDPNYAYAEWSTVEIIKHLEDNGLKGNQLMTQGSLKSYLTDLGSKTKQNRHGGKRAWRWIGVKLKPDVEVDTDNLNF